MKYFIVALADGQSAPINAFTTQAEGAYYAAVDVLRQYLGAHPAQYLYFNFVPNSSSVMQAGRMVEAEVHEMLDIYIDLNNIWSTEHTFHNAARPIEVLYPVVKLVHHV